MITYVTGNYGKYIAVKEKFEKENIDINFYKYDIKEIDINDIKLISKDKAKKAYDLVKGEVFVADTGFFINNYPSNPGYPGAYVKRSGVSSKIDELLEVMKDVDDRSCYFLDCLTYYDGDKYYQFFGKSEGTLSRTIKGLDKEEAKSNLWKVFIPKNETKTLSEMTKEELDNRKDNHTSATVEFINFIKRRKEV